MHSYLLTYVYVYSILKNITEDTRLIMKTTRKFDQISKTVKNISKTNGEIISRLLEIGKKKTVLNYFFSSLLFKNLFFYFVNLITDIYC